MIVNPVPEGWEIIYQQAHAMLAAEIAFRWRRDLVPSFRYLETLAAIAQHDDGQAPWRGHDALTPAGAPADFAMTTDHDLEQARQVMYEAHFQGRWRSFLTSMHMSFLYESLRGTDHETDAFLDEQRLRQQEWRSGLGVTESEAQVESRILGQLRFENDNELAECLHRAPIRMKSWMVVSGARSRKSSAGVPPVKPLPDDL